jgi:HEAT repeat protein
MESVTLSTDGSRSMARTFKRAVAGLALLGLCAACRSKAPEPNVGNLIADLQSADPAVSGKANLELIRVGEPAVPSLVAMLESSDPRLRTLAANTLWGMGSKGRAAVPALAGTLNDREPSLRVAAAMALENMGPDAAPAVPALIPALKDRDAKVRQWAAKALGRIGPAAEKAVPALAQAAKTEGIRVAAEEAIRQIRGVESPTEPAPSPSPLSE